MNVFIFFGIDVAHKVFFSGFNHKHAITIQKELRNLNLPKDTFGFGYLVKSWYDLPDWESKKEYINPGIDFLTTNLFMMYSFLCYVNLIKI